MFDMGALLPHGMHAASNPRAHVHKFDACTETQHRPKCDEGHPWPTHSQFPEVPSSLQLSISPGTAHWLQHLVAPSKLPPSASAPQLKSAQHSRKPHLDTAQPAMVTSGHGVDHQLD